MSVSRARVFLLGTLALTATGAWAQETASSWIARMNSAVEELSYRGVFVHMQGTNVETMLIVHANRDGRVSERTMSLDGAGREIIREGEQVRCILPDSETVLLEDSGDASPLIAALPSYTEGLAAHYDFTMHRRTARVADRRTQIVSILPRDDLRYGYRLWLDVDTAMPLKSQLVDETGATVEQVLFTRIEITDGISKSELEPTINTEGFAFYRAPPIAAPAQSKMSLVTGELPNGFQLSVATKGPMAGSKHLVDHLVYTDGLATVSVFVEDPKSSSEIAMGHSRLGSANAYSLTTSGRQVTAVGEVPRRTVELIAKSLRDE